MCWEKGRFFHLDSEQGLECLGWSPAGPWFLSFLPPAAKCFALTPTSPRWLTHMPPPQLHPARPFPPPLKTGRQEESGRSRGRAREPERGRRVVLAAGWAPVVLAVEEVPGRGVALHVPPVGWPLHHRFFPEIRRGWKQPQRVDEIFSLHEHFLRFPVLWGREGPWSPVEGVWSRQGWTGPSTYLGLHGLCDVLGGLPREGQDQVEEFDPGLSPHVPWKGSGWAQKQRETIPALPEHLPGGLLCQPHLHG